jgi:hypothetical protein
MVYGAQAWYTGPNGKQTKSNLTQLELIQNKCLRRITGGYKRTPRAAMEREAKVQPLDLYCDTLTMNRALKDRGSKVKEEIKRTVDEIWETGQQLRQGSQRHRGSQREARQRPPTGAEHVLQRAIEREQEIHAYQAWLAQRPRRARRPRANRPPPGQP